MQNSSIDRVSSLNGLDTKNKISQKQPTQDFSKILSESLDEVNKLQKDSEKAMA